MSTMAKVKDLQIESVRRDFPILSTKMRGKPIVYLDNGASTQKPLVTIECMDQFQRAEYASVHRGVYSLSEKSTERFEGTRKKIAEFLGTENEKEIVITKGTTESLNLVAYSFARNRITAGDEVLVSAMEHHSNIVPWQMVCEEKGATVKVIPMNENGELLLDEYKKLLNDKTKLVALGHISNSLGTINPIKKMVEMAHEKNIPVVVDGAQAAPHTPINVKDLGCDFYAISAHKMFGPTGVGALYGRYELLEEMPPFNGGGDMIASVTFEKTHFRNPPQRFEAGTPNVTDVIGFGATIDYLHSIGMEKIQAYEKDLLAYGTQALSTIPEVRMIGNAKEKAAILSFVVDDIHPHDLGTMLDQDGVCIRAGHHCAQPVMDFFQVPATARASLAFYNNEADIDALVKALKKAIEVFGR